MIAPWTPPPLLRASAPISVWNALISQCGRPVGLAAKGATAVFESVAPPRRPQLAACVEAPPLRAAVLFDSFPFASLFEARLETDDLDRLPPALRDALIEGMLAMVWALVPRNRLPPFAILGVGDWGEVAAAVGADLDWLAVAIHGLAPQPARLRVGCRAAEAARVMMEGDLAAAAVWAGVRASLALEAFHWLGSLALPLAAARALAHGDVVVLAALPPATRALRLRGELHRFQQAQGAWIYRGCTPPPRRRRNELGGMCDMTKNDGDDGATTLSTLMLELDFDLGGAQIPLAAIESWRVGAIVEFDPPAPADGVEVTMRVNGHALGKGELIRIDDRLAVRLTRLFLS